MCYPENPPGGRHIKHSFSRRTGHCSSSAAVTNPSSSPALGEAPPAAPDPVATVTPFGGEPRLPQMRWVMGRSVSTCFPTDLPLGGRIPPGPGSSPSSAQPLQTQSFPSPPPSDPQLSRSYAKPVFLVPPGNAGKCHHHHQLTEDIPTATSRSWDQAGSPKHLQGGGLGAVTQTGSWKGPFDHGPSVSWSRQDRQ